MTPQQLLAKYNKIESEQRAKNERKLRAQSHALHREKEALNLQLFKQLSQFHKRHKLNLVTTFMNQQIIQGSMNRETADSQQEKIWQSSLSFPTDISKSKELADIKDKLIDRRRPSVLGGKPSSSRTSVAGDDVEQRMLRRPTRLSQSIKDFVALKNIEKKKAVSDALD